MAQQGKQMRVPPGTEAALRRARPAAFEHSTAHGILTLACEAAQIDAPPPPSKRKAAGGAALTGEAKARNRHGDKLRLKEFERYKCRDCRTWIVSAEHEATHIKGNYHIVRERNRLARKR